MSQRVPSRRPIRLLLGLAVASLAVTAGACSSSSDDSGSATTTTAAATTDGTSKTDSPGTTESESPGTTEAKEIGNTEIRDALEADQPELWALVNFDYMSWNAFGGFVIPVADGTDSAKAVELCDAVIAVVDTGSGAGTEVVVATGVEAGNLKGTPVAQRVDEADACVAV